MLKLRQKKLYEEEVKDLVSNAKKIERLYVFARAILTLATCLLTLAQSRLTEKLSDDYKDAMAELKAARRSNSYEPVTRQ